VTVAVVLGTPVAETPPAATVAAADPVASHAVAPTASVDPVTLATADATIAVEDHAHSACPIWRIICITRGDSGARRGLQPSQTFPGMLEADTSSQATRSPIRLTRRAHRRAFVGLRRKDDL
jgi:hypothetical protein